MNISTFFTFSRICLIPFIVIIYYSSIHHRCLVCTMLFLIASITDILDGLLARYLKQVTKFGDFLDPVADKLLVSSILLLIIEKFHAWWITFPSICIISREIIISAFREWIGINNSVRLSVIRIGKVKTIFQMFSLCCLLLTDKLGIMPGTMMLYITVILTFFSMIKYFVIVITKIYNH